MQPIVSIAMLCACAAAVAVQSLFFVHMLQLNSYRNERYGKWCRENVRRLVSPARLLPLLAVFTPLLPSAVAADGVALALFALSAVLCIPKKAKKPLVFTPRVRRLFATQAVLTVGLLVLAALLPGTVGHIVIPAVLAPLTWALTWLSNTLNLPMENAISRGYIRDARRRLAELPQLTVIGITGSYGKTSTKNFLHALLSAKYNVLMTPESYNTTMGVVRTIRERLRPSHQIFIAEMGAKNPGDIAEICELVHPRYGVLTSIGEQHLETFRTLDNIIRTKFELVDALPPDGMAFLNTDNPYIRARAVTNVPVCAYGVDGGDYTAADIAVDNTGCSFTVTAPDGESRRFTTKLLGAHNIQNLVGCIAVAHKLGIPLAELVYPVRMLKPVAHRLQLLPNGFIDDAYNSNPAGFRGALDVLRGFDAQRVLVTPGMVELGDRQDALNRELGAYAADCCDYAVLVGEKQAPPLAQGLADAGFPAERVFVAATLQEGLAYLNTLPAGKRIVLLENDLPDNF